MSKHKHTRQKLQHMRRRKRRADRRPSEVEKVEL